MLEYRPATLLKRDSNIGVSSEICEIFKKTFFYRTPPSAASVHLAKRKPIMEDRLKGALSGQRIYSN